jgi:hypothetical protein
MSKYLYTRDLAKRMDELEELETAVADAKEALADADPDEDNVALHEDLDRAIEDFDEAEIDELKELREIEAEVSGWRYGETLIPEEDFVSYCRGLLEDIGDLTAMTWYIAIDMDATAENLKADYVEVEYLGNTYLVRSP